MVMEEGTMSKVEEDLLAEKLANLIGTTPTQDEKQNVHTFLTNVANADDTTKTGFLSVEELGNMELTERAYKELALISSDIMSNIYFEDFFKKEAEITTSTSLSKEAKLLELAVVQRRELADVTKKRKKNAGWFRKKDKEEEEE